MLLARRLGGPVLDGLLRFERTLDPLRFIDVWIDEGGGEGGGDGEGEGADASRGNGLASGVASGDATRSIPCDQPS